MKYSDSNLPPIGTEVTLADVEADNYTSVDLPRGRVIHPTDTAPPDEGMVFVSWGRWEYGEDLQNVADLLARM